MLDAYIIEKIRREREHKDTRIPLHIEVPQDPRERAWDRSRDRPGEEPRWRDDRRDRGERRDREDEGSERGVVIIDFTV